MQKRYGMFRGGVRWGALMFIMSGKPDYNLVVICWMWYAVMCGSCNSRQAYIYSTPAPRTITNASSWPTVSAGERLHCTCQVANCCGIEPTSCRMPLMSSKDYVNETTVFRFSSQEGILFWRRCKWACSFWDDFNMALFFLSGLEIDYVCNSQ